MTLEIEPLAESRELVDVAMCVAFSPSRSVPGTGLCIHGRHVTCLPAILDRNPLDRLKNNKRTREPELLISYNSSKIQEICFLASAAAKHLGAEAAISLQARHADLQAAENINDILVGQISIDENLCILTLPDPLTIEMIPNYGTINEGDVYDWSTVERVKIVGINDVR